MNIAKINFIDGIINFFASLACPTWDCTKEDLSEMGIIKGVLPPPVCAYRPEMDDDIILDEDPMA